MKVLLVGLEKASLAQYIHKHYRRDIQIVRRKPDFVLCYGGDGTLLYAERHYQSLPKVMIRKSRVCNLCAELSRKAILDLLISGRYSLTEHPLLESRINGKTIYGLNDILVAHATVNAGLRFRTYINNKPYGGELLGDGVLMATPLGSTGYFQSITRSTFQQGLGIAFNNTICTLNHLVMPDDTVVKVKIDRGPAAVVADNDKHFIPLKTNDVVIIKRSYRSAVIVTFSGKGNERFNVGIGEMRVPLGVCQMCGKPLQKS